MIFDKLLNAPSSKFFLDLLDGIIAILVLANTRTF